MKGMELPVNVLVIIVIAVIVLIALVALFMVSWGQGSRGIAIDTAKNSACQRYISLGCCESTCDSTDEESITFNTVVCQDAEADNLNELRVSCFNSKPAIDLCCK